MGYKLINNVDNEAIVFDKEGMLQASDYWTEERMKNAIPIEITVPMPDGMTLNKETVVSEVKDADINVMPYKPGGKLFFTQGGSDYVGSAEFCADKNLILTAAHCIRDMDTGEWSENIVFKRGYNYLLCKQNISIRASAIKAYWYSQKNYCWDYALCVASEASSVDILGYEIDTSVCDTTAFGYPSNYKSGEKMQTVSSKITLNQFNTGTLKMEGNTMGGGCSGGAWVKKGTNTVISLNSFSYKNDKNTIYGPMLTENFISLLDYAKTLI